MRIIKEHVQRYDEWRCRRAVGSATAAEESGNWIGAGNILEREIKRAQRRGRDDVVPFLARRAAEAYRKEAYYSIRMLTELYMMARPGIKKQRGDALSRATYYVAATTDMLELGKDQEKAAVMKQVLAYLLTITDSSELGHMLRDGPITSA